jgi:hypothetical protein
MQRLLNNLLTVAVIGLVSTSASLVMAKGGGGHGSGHHSGHSAGHSHSSHHSSSKGGSHRGVRHTSFSHDSHSRSFGHYGFHDHTNLLTVGERGGYRGHLPGYWPIYVSGNHPRWYCHDHYPVHFWFGGNFGVVGTDVVNTGVAVGGIDVEFTKIAQLDAGDPAKNLAPAYRVWFHNNSTVDINQPFDVSLLAANDEKLSEGLPSASVRVDSLAADETLSVDIRLPIAAMTMGTADGQPAPYAYVHTIIDSQNELVETNKTNNLSVDGSDDIPAVQE